MGRRQKSAQQTARRSTSARRTGRQQGLQTKVCERDGLSRSAWGWIRETEMQGKQGVGRSANGNHAHASARSRLSFLMFWDGAVGQHDRRRVLSDVGSATSLNDSLR